MRISLQWSCPHPQRGFFSWGNKLLLSRTKLRCTSLISLGFILLFPVVYEEINNWISELDLYKGDENTQRGNWTSKLDFLLSMIGYAVGLGNVWRFPFLTYKNGGGAFLIPYFFMLFVAGIPLYFMEECIGQYSSLGPIRVWNCLPGLRGIAIGAIIAYWLTSITYAVVITYCLFYLAVSFTTHLPWSDCNNDWNTIYCGTLGKECLNQSSIIIGNGSCYHPSKLTQSELETYNVTESSPGVYDLTNYIDPLENDRVSASEEYWTRKVRKESHSIGETGGIVWELAICLFATYVIIFLSLFKGIKSSGKVVYFTATFPYIVLFALFCLGMTLPGHREGISFFIKPKWELLLEENIWMDAAIQIFYSVGPIWGAIITLSSYNNFHNNSCKDSILVPLINCLTSLFSGFVIFSIVGFMAHELNQPVESVVAEGYGLAFIAYPQAFTILPVPALWSVLFFLMLLTLGLDSSFASMETTVTVILDEFPRIRKYKTYVCGIACTMSFLFGLLYVTEAGPYWANLMDQSAVGFQILMVGLVECSAISWIYGVRRFKNDIRSMIGNDWVDHPTFWYWIVTWTVLTPLVLGVILIANWIDWSEPTYNGPYPSWALAIGWCISAITLVWIPVVLVYELIRAKGSLLKRLKVVTSPAIEWGPALQQHRNEAWLVHQTYGTSMGGRLNLFDDSATSNSADLKEKEQFDEETCFSNETFKSE